MITILSKIFIKDNKNYNNSKVRNLYGVLCGVVGIVLNVVLFAIKFFAGVISNSVAISADAFNNLSDAGSSFITLIGFKLAAKKPDPEHPFGHGRMEYIAGLIVTAIIAFMGITLFKDSVVKIFAPEETELSFVVILILIISILVKLYMALYNFSVGKKIKSSTMRATGLDSLSDIIATAVALVSMVISHYTNFNIDGYAGILVSLFICYAAFESGKEVIGPLLGQPPTKEFVEQIEEIVLSHDGIVGIHDLVVHDYGPGRVMITLHAEVPANVDVVVSHDVIDTAEEDLESALNCHATIHLDPVEIDNPYINDMKEKVTCIVKGISEEMSLHDFRVVPNGGTHTNILFDVVRTHSVEMNDAEIKSIINKEVKELMGESYFCVIKIDEPYIKQN